MQLKKFTAPTIHEALRKIKAELGDDAIIFDLRTGSGKSGRTPTGSPWVEVTAAIERNRTPRSPCSSTIPSRLTERVRSECTKDRAAAAIPPQTWSLPSQGDCILQWAATSYSPYLQNMLLSGFTHTSAGYLIGEAAAAYAGEPHDVTFGTVLQNHIGKYLKIGGPIVPVTGQKKKVAFIGPTGVGKTTTLAKVAAHYACRHDIDVKILTIDTYRIAAAEQLKIYGAIMNLEVAVAADKEEFDKALQRYADAELVLIDTAGRNYRDSMHLAALGAWLGQYPDIETYLLLSAATTPDVLSATLRCFLQHRVNYLIITKIDETIRFGHLYDILAGSGLPISYVTNGQRVPEDILPATAPLLAELMLNGYGDTARIAG
ncbi:MAG: hypothetical protein N3B18_00205 [Desulfobacterota bacterium]|nr:hypothetical protein [Thermodesulfobacteriota bacterium]